MRAPGRTSGSGDKHPLRVQLEMFRGLSNPCQSAVHEFDAGDDDLGFRARKGRVEILGEAPVAAELSQRAQLSFYRLEFVGDRVAKILLLQEGPGLGTGSEELKDQIPREQLICDSSTNCRSPRPRRTFRSPRDPPFGP